MKIFVADTYEGMSKKAADDIILLMQQLRQPLICTASGDSPAGLYRELVQRVNAKESNIADWYFISLDEWGGMNGSDEGSCRFHLNNQLFDPLDVADERIIFFDGRGDLQGECVKVE